MGDEETSGDSHEERAPDSAWAPHPADAPARQEPHDQHNVNPAPREDARDRQPQATPSARRPDRHDPRPQRMADGALVLRIPALSLVALIGASGSGKSTFAARHFAPTEVLSSDHYRAVVGDDPNDQSVTNAAYDALHHIAGLRLALGRLTVIDATNVKPQDRAGLVHLAHEHDTLPVAIVLDIDERVAHARNATRPDRQFGPTCRAQPGAGVAAWAGWAAARRLPSGLHPALGGGDQCRAYRAHAALQRLSR